MKPTTITMEINNSELSDIYSFIDGVRSHLAYNIDRDIVDNWLSVWQRKYRKHDYWRVVFDRNDVRILDSMMYIYSNGYSKKYVVVEELRKVINGYK